MPSISRRAQKTTMQKSSMGLKPKASSLRRASTIAQGLGGVAGGLGAGRTYLNLETATSLDVMNSSSAG
jgi:hypothetical protein